MLIQVFIILYLSQNLLLWSYQILFHSQKWAPYFDCNQDLHTFLHILYYCIRPFLHFSFLSCFFFVLMFWCCGFLHDFCVSGWKTCCLAGLSWKICLKLLENLLRVIGFCAQLMNVAGFNPVLHVPLKLPEFLGSSKTARSRIARSPAWWSWANCSCPVCLQAWVNLQVTANYYAISLLFCLNLIIVYALHPVFLHKV